MNLKFQEICSKKVKMSCVTSNNGGVQQKRPITIIGLEGSANKIGIGIVRDGEVKRMMRWKILGFYRRPRLR